MEEEGQVCASFGISVRVQSVSPILASLDRGLRGLDGDVFGFWEGEMRRSYGDCHNEINGFVRVKRGILGIWWVYKCHSHPADSVNTLTLLAMSKMGSSVQRVQRVSFLTDIRRGRGKAIQEC
jgi:hypothetical protein